MSETAKLSWSEADVNGLKGQPESIRLEFKSGRMFDGDQKQKWIDQLSKEVSAFANTEGGDLILGVDEDRSSKPKVAADIDGVPAEIGPEQLQQLIESNVSPYLPGIRVRRVQLSARADRVVFVVQIPQGSTAYQATDRRYYGRSEFEAKPLPDHEIRLRMSRGKVARGTILTRLVAVELGIERERRRRGQVEAERTAAERRAKEGTELEIGQRKPDGSYELYNPNYTLELAQARFLRDSVTVGFAFRNDGELTIRAPAVEFQETRNGHLFDDGLVQIIKSAPTRIKLDDAIIYPGDEHETDRVLAVECKREAVLTGGDYKLSWRVFLDNSPPSFGDIDLGTVIQDARVRKSKMDD